MINYQKLISFLLKSGRLKSVKRSGWVREKMPEPETVAEHSWRVCVLALILAKQLGVDQSRLAKMAIFHDLEEAETKDPVTERGRVRLRDHNEEKVPNFMEIYSVWEEHIPESGLRKTKYSDLLYQLGKVATCWQALEYELAGADPRRLDEFWDNAYTYASHPVIVRLLREMEKLRRKKWPIEKK
jgi:5'-deoxynucleotidase YfbR-like HD superfamily hydrolase